MLTLIIAAAVGFAVTLITTRDLGAGWGIFCGVAMLLITQMIIGLIIRKKVNNINNKIQTIMNEAQAKISRRAQLFSQRPGGNVRMMQQTLEEEQSSALRRALSVTDEAKPLYWWNILLKKQINTMKMMFHFQLREFDKVDAMLKDCLLFDPRSQLIKLVRMFKKEDPALDQYYSKKARRMKGDDVALFACTYAWMKLKNEQTDAALAALVDARKRSDNPVLTENWERLINGKVKHFSNANFGDVWYSLYLETPKFKQQRVQQRP